MRSSARARVRVRAASLISDAPKRTIGFTCSMPAAHAATRGTRPLRARYDSVSSIASSVTAPVIASARATTSSMRRAGRCSARSLQHDEALRHRRVARVEQAHVERGRLGRASSIAARAESYIALNCAETVMHEHGLRSARGAADRLDVHARRRRGRRRALARRRGAARRTRACRRRASRRTCARRR